TSWSFSSSCPLPAGRAAALGSATAHRAALNGDQVGGRQHADLVDRQAGLGGLGLGRFLHARSSHQAAFQLRGSWIRAVSRASPRARTVRAQSPTSRVISISSSVEPCLVENTTLSVCASAMILAFASSSSRALNSEP